MALLSSTRLQPAEVAARLAEHYAQHEAHGYSQPGRHGDGTSETVNLGDNTLVSIAGGDRDCSSLSISCYADQDISTGGASYTLDMWELTLTGNFVQVPVSERQRGDILNTTTNRHAAVYLGDGMLAEAYMSETGGTGGAQGDQTGWEVRVTDYYDDDWTACYRCVVRRDVTGWIKDDATGRWWYRHEDGSYTTNGWEYINGEWYRFDAGGWMVTGWVFDEGHWFFCDLDSGAMRTGWLWDDGHWYWLATETGSPRGAMAASTCVCVGGSWYAFDSLGHMLRQVSTEESGALVL